MTHCIATMSSGIGWETKSINKGMELHFYYWFVAKESQSKLIGSIPSFYALWKRYGEKQNELQAAVKEFLKLYMQEQFPIVNVDCQFIPVDNTQSLYNLAVNVTVTDNEISYSLAKIIEVNPNNFQLLEKHRSGT